MAQSKTEIMRVRRSKHEDADIGRLLSGECVVALDTNILDRLEKNSPPTWLPEFQRMKNSGVRFVIPDLCVGERIECFTKACASSIPSMKLKWKQMAKQLDSIIWRDLPCVPLQGDLFDIVGIKERGVTISRQDPFTVCKAKKLYQHLHGYECSLYNVQKYRVPFEEVIDKKRADWIAAIKKIRQLLNFDACGDGNGHKISKDTLLKLILMVHSANFTFEWLDSSILELPFRFLVERVYDKSYCNPCLGRRHKNDGLDYLILYLTMASVNVCSTDRFFAQARNLGLPQSFCCHTPKTLLEAWGKGALPRVKVQG